MRLGVGWLWCGGLHGSRCRCRRACCGFGPWQSGDAPVDYVDPAVLFDVGQARAHLEGAVDPVSCPVCAYDERNRALHGYMQESLF